MGTPAADRFAVGDRDPLVYNGDGSLDSYLQHENPARDNDAPVRPAPVCSRWIVAPTGGTQGLSRIPQREAALSARLLYS